MSCIYKDRCDVCTMYEKEIHDGLTYENSEFGFAKENDGTCAVDDDPNPFNNCEMFEPIDESEYEQEG